MKKYVGIITLFIALLVAPPVWSMDTPPDQLVEETVQEVLTSIGENDLVEMGHDEEILALVEDIILPHFNFSRMTQLAMGKNWRKADAEQQDALTNEFRDLLVRTYSNTLSKYRDERIEVTPINDLGDKTKVIVETKVLQGSGRQPVPINYRMEKTTIDWKAYDVVVAGVSLVTNYRGSFDSQIRKGGVEGLLKTLQDKNRTLENQ